MIPQVSRYNIRKSLIALGVLILLLVGSYWLYNELTFRITGINPTAKTFTAASPFLKVTFNKTLATTGITVTSNPQAINSYYISGRTVVIDLSVPLDPSQTYTFHLYNLADKSGKYHIVSKTYSFKPLSATTPLPSDQQQVQLNKQAQYSKIIGSDPLLQQLPFTGASNEFNISYNVTYSPNLKITVVITAPSASAQADAMSWITSQGINPSNYTIQYVTAQP